VIEEVKEFDSDGEEILKGRMLKRIMEKNLEMWDVVY
jgi:hypothetical protein